MPNVFMHTTSPQSPLYWYHAKWEAASTHTRALTLRGSTLSLYSSLCFSNSSMQGMDTTRTFLPFSVSRSFAPMHISTSEPVPMSIASGVPSQSESTYAPRSAFSPVPGYCGRFCLVSMMAVGQEPERAETYAAAVSLPSQGRKTLIFGMERRDISCSIG